MGCCHGGRVGGTDGQDPNLIIDVEKVLADDTWDMFRVSFSKFQRRFLKRKQFKIEVPMNYFNFEEVSQAKVTLRDCPQGIDVSGAPGPKKTNPGHIGLETEFNNDTDEQQTYTFQFEKTRTAAVEVSYQKGYSIGAKANFSIGLPPVFGDGSVGFEVEKQLQVTNASGERFEETLKTSATSNIVVTKRSKYTASVIMEERNMMADFKITVRMTMPAQKAPIYIKDVKTGDTVFVRTVRNLPRLFRTFKDVKRVPDTGENEGRDRLDAVDFSIEGIIQGVQLSSHRINLYSHPKPDEKPEVKSKETVGDLLGDLAADDVAVRDNNVG
nr:hypothetical protein BaRGS_005612 [Batillaria attramentaria]